ncbi:MAG: homoserine O-acetyltransferase [Melioribacteraceae bacterium]|nr:homoserine O-acetyltransferase [Melioribacteraceae bacterium]MCF8395776.1 homoserine O-acetyltransferase [Melioribacteraceae bacterium]MCF8420905.1 homoserine O-acetyltransferase [Melioribacteraceae bacterium]
MNSEIKQIKLYDETDPLKLECGEELENVELAYTTYGKLNEDGTNAVIVCHALTGDAHVAGELHLTEELKRNIPFYSAMKDEQPGWWHGLIGKGKIIDTNKYFVISSNIIGSCYGSTGPASINPKTGNPYRMNFPQVTVRDVVKAQRRLIDKLGVKKIKTITGGSLGGMQALEWAIMYPGMVESIIPIATSVRHSALGIALNHIGRQAIMSDPNWNGGDYKSERINGLSIARQLGMVSYRTEKSFMKKFGRERFESNNLFDEKNLYQVESYLNYQGQKLINRFDPNAYIIISRVLDLHDVGRGRGSIKNVLQSIKAKALCIGIDSDILYPAYEQKDIANQIPGSEYKEIISEDGHDAFLIEFDQMEKIIKPFLQSID